MSKLEQRLRETVGLDAGLLGKGSLAIAIRRRMKNLGLHKVQDYECLLDHSPAAWTDLLEELLVAETWFFRERAAFEALRRLVLDSWLPAHPTGTLRLLSVPCASGEEPYSVAMTLLDAGLLPQRFDVDAADLSARALTCARRAVYGKNSFRDTDLRFRDRYFHPTSDGFALDQRVRSCVRFSQVNLFDPGFAAVRGLYDFIFFRNLLIYFDSSKRQLALDTILRLLSPAGVLFVGPAEQSLVLDRGFVAVHFPKAFGYRNAAAAPRPAPAGTLARQIGALPPLQSTVRSTPGVPTAELTRPRGGGRHDSLSAELNHAHRLADAGRLTEAEAICNAHLSQARDSAEVYYLLGLVREAGGQANAVDYYRKALYLEPNHYESLMQMALLARKSGDLAAALTFRRRAERLRPDV